MSARVQEAATTGAETATVVAAPLQRSCACGATAGASGRCNACATQAQLGVQPKLTIGAPGDRYEQEADQIADQVISARPGAPEAPSAITPLSRPAPLARQAADESEVEEEALQAKTLPAPGPGAAAPGFARRLASATQSGRPLDSATRGFFEPRFGRNLGRVRLHETPSAAALNREIGARAFTHGNHVFLGDNAFRNDPARRQRLLAHEITHTIQQKGLGYTALQRAPEDDEGEDKAKVESYPVDQIHAYTKATSREAMILSQERVDAVHDGPGGPYFPGDLILVSVWRDTVRGDPKSGLNGIVEPIEWTLPAGDLELAKTAAPGSQQSNHFLRVTADPATLGDGRTVEVGMESDAFDGTVTLSLTLEAAPEDKVAVDPVGLEKEEALEAHKDERGKLRQELTDLRRGPRRARQTLREEQQAERKALRERQEEEGAYTRKERKADREERQALRRAQKGARGKLREDQSKERDALKEKKGQVRGRIKDERRQIKALRGDIREIDKDADCTLEQQHLIETALETAMSRAAAALARIQPGAEPDPFTQAKLKAYFRLDATPENRDAVRSTLQRTVDVINLAINSMKVADHTQFVCADSPLACNESTGAFVTDLLRGGTVTVCHKWIMGTADYGVASAGDPGRAFSLLHEFIHLSGITRRDGSGDETYTHAEDWEDLSPGDAAEMADAYAAFAWEMGRGGTASDEGGDGS